MRVNGACYMKLTPGDVCEIFSSIALRVMKEKRDSTIQSYSASMSESQRKGFVSIYFKPRTHTEPYLGIDFIYDQVSDILENQGVLDLKQFIRSKISTAIDEFL